ncbi:hypothetical protein AMECASPLE_034598 [Ameca splendens]|uniref:Uncharacterized protein n=1 Tax=Ameca splendens TaxID=208324 RepID=A0ABV0XKD2_9TELE
MKELNWKEPTLVLESKQRQIYLGLIHFLSESLTLLSNQVYFFSNLRPEFTSQKTVPSPSPNPEESCSGTKDTNLSPYLLQTRPQVRSSETDLGPDQTTESV